MRGEQATSRRSSRTVQSLVIGSVCFLVWSLASAAPASANAVLGTGTLDFSTQPVNTTSGTQSTSLTNDDPSNPISISISVSSDYNENDDCGSSLAASMSCTITVSFHPTIIGNDNGSVTITTDAPNGNQSITLLGTGTGAIASLTPDPISFGSQRVGTTSTAHLATIANNGNVAMNVSSVTAGGDFAASGCVGPVASGGSCSISVTFHPTSAGSKGGTLTVATDATNGTQTSSLNGTGTAPAVTLSPSTLSFGNQGLNTSSAPKYSSSELH